MAVLIVWMTVGLQGCALSYDDAAGNRHIIGLVDIAITPSEGSRLAGDIVEVSTAGISYLSSAQSTSFAIGYNRITNASFADNSVALGPFDWTAFKSPSVKHIPNKEPEK
jgi:hypothetical protein